MGHQPERFGKRTSQGRFQLAQHVVTAVSRRDWEEEVGGSRGLKEGEREKAGTRQDSNSINLVILYLHSNYSMNRLWSKRWRHLYFWLLHVSVLKFMFYNKPNLTVTAKNKTFKDSCVSLICDYFAFPSVGNRCFLINDVRIQEIEIVDLLQNPLEVA